MNGQNNADVELKAMQELAAAMKYLDGAPDEQTNRVVRWFVDRYAPSTATLKPAMSPIGVGDAGSVGAEVPRFESLGDLFAAADPQTEPDRALVAGYWYQFVEAQPDFGGFTLNKALRDLGYPVGNITNALSALGNRSPKLAIQLKKAGTSKQARKTYKLTAAGKIAVEGMIRHQ
jgi:hypothetical protein